MCYLHVISLSSVRIGEKQFVGQLFHIYINYSASNIMKVRLSFIVRFDWSSSSLSSYNGQYCMHVACVQVKSHQTAIIAWSVVVSTRGPDSTTGFFIARCRLQRMWLSLPLYWVCWRVLLTHQISPRLIKPSPFLLNLKLAMSCSHQ